MGLMKTAVRFLLAFVGIFAVFQPFPVLLTPPDPITSLIVSGMVAVVSVPVAVVFVRQSYSLERLYGFLLGMYIVSFALLVLSTVVGILIGSDSPFPNEYEVIAVAVQLVLLLVSSATAFHLVYRGGYARLKARFA